MEPIPNIRTEFKPEFVRVYSQLTDFETFKKYCLSYLRKSVRINTLKIGVEECKSRLEKKGWALESVPWCTEGFWIKNEERRDVGNLFEHHMGYFYVQEAASMIPPIVLSPKPGERVLDMCAAPGSKTTQIAALMKNSGIVVANDYKAVRLAALGMNVQRVGASNVVQTLLGGQQIKGLEFDKILVDAPCSGTGTIGKSLKTIQMWNPKMVKRLHNQQKQLLESAWKLLRKGGTLVYSTCTLEPFENEGSVSYILEKSDAVAQDIELTGIKRSKSVESFEGVKFHPDTCKSLRIWPQDNYTEGFFVAKILKKP